MAGSAIYLAPSRTRRKSGDREKNVAVEKKMNRIGRGLSRSAWPFIRLAKWNLVGSFWISFGHRIRKYIYIYFFFLRSEEILIYNKIYEYSFAIVAINLAKESFIR